jgi:predicted nuclease with TOPRIM domain
MKKLDSTNAEETLNQEVKRLRKENSKLKSQKEASDAQVKALKKELKKKDVLQVTLTKEQLELLSKVFPDINSLFN